ncbi:MAG: hypothetical protein WEB57_12030 [Pseudohongiellaceae bacterium]
MKKESGLGVFPLPDFLFCLWPEFFPTVGRKFSGVEFGHVLILFQERGEKTVMPVRYKPGESGLTIRTY